MLNILSFLGDEWSVVLIVLILFFVSFGIFDFFRSRVSPSSNLLVVISGCDTGLGELLCERLSSLGFTVFAGCLTEVGKKRWKGSPRVEAFLLDVTDEKSVNSVGERVLKWLRSSPGRSLHSVVNNAGIGEGGLVDWMAMEKFRRTLEVNFFGAVALTKVLLPILLDASSAAAKAGLPPPRVVNVASVAGILAVPGLSAYCASKFALEAFSDSLRLELSPWRCPVALIEPSFLATPIIAGTKEKQESLWESLPAPTRNRWGVDYFRSAMRQSERTLASAESPALGLRALEDAVTHSSPSARYKAGTPGKTYLPLIAALPAYLSDPILLLAGAGGGVKPSGMA